MSEFLTTVEAARRVGASRVSIYRKCLAGELPALRVGQDFRIRAADLDAWARYTPSPRQSAPAIGSSGDLLGNIEAWRAYLLNVRGLAPTTVTTHGKHLRCYFKRLGASGAPITTVASVFERATLVSVFGQIPAKSYALKLNIYNALLSLGNYLAAEGKLEPAALANVKPLKPRRQVEPRRTHLKADAVEHLFDAILTRPYPPAENATFAAIAAVMVYGGLRISEVTKLRPQDVDLAGRVITVHNGKGGKTRRIGITNALLTYLEQFRR